MNDSTGKLPVSVNYAAGLFWLAAGVLALAFFANAQWRLLYAVLITLFVAVGWGLRRGNRVAQVAAFVMGGLLTVLGLITLAADAAIGAGVAGFGLLLVVLLLVPTGARRFFARDHSRLGTS